MFACCLMVIRCGLMQCTCKRMRSPCSGIPVKGYGREKGHFFMVEVTGGDIGWGFVRKLVFDADIDENFISGCRMFV